MIETVWLDNPPVNAVNAGIIDTLWDAFENLGNDVRAVVLRGRGERAFSAGADISGFVAGVGESERPGGIQPVADLIEQAPVPVVAAIHGYCLGGGLEIALACDFRIATRDAQLGFPEVNLGLLPGGGGTQRAPRLIAPGRARWLTMSGERIPAETAEAWGLVEFLVDDLESGIERYVEPLDRQSPHALRQIKQLYLGTRDARSDEREVRAFAECLESEDGQEGVAAFLEKRQANWTGSVKAVVLREVGGDLALEEWEEPSGVVVDVRAAGVNFLDVLVRRGLYPQMPELPHVLGSEVAGDLDGRRVVAFADGSGGYAERVAVDPNWVFELPEHATYADGAGFLMTYLTAYIPLVTARRAERVLVHAGAGGVGSAAIQLAKQRGATVFATASTPEKREFARDAGADDVRGYDEIDDLRVDLVLDPVGGETFTRSLPLLSPLGTIVAIGFAGGLWQDPSVQWLVGRNVSVFGFYLGRLLRLEPEYVRSCADELLALWRERAIDPIVGAQFALADARDAHALIEARRNVGKVVLEP